MRGLVQRVRQASVSARGETLGSIGSGLLIFLGIGAGDSEEDARYLVERIVHLRIFADDASRFSHSALEAGASLLVISQFTLYADTRKGRRPSFTDAASPREAELVFNQTLELFRRTGLPVATGRFAEDMLVSLENDGPVTIWLDSVDRLRPRRG